MKMVSLVQRATVISALCTFLTAICASKIPIQGILAFRELNKAPTSIRGNSSVDFPRLVPLLSGIDAHDSLIFSRQEEVCPLNAPVQCPDGIHCTTADYDVCCSDGEHTCKTGDICCNGGAYCAPAGGFCCGNVACDGGDVCCPGGCAPPESTCCGSQIYCSQGQTCCGQGCADVGSTCCGTSHQCEANEQCCPGGKNGCAPKDATCCGPDLFCNKGELCCIGTISNSTYTDYFCSPGPKCIDTLYLDLGDYPGMDEIFENMCRGILQSPLFNENIPNELILTYIGKGQTSVASQNRRDAGCAGSPCAKLFSETGPNGKRIGWSCDEFPFATSMEGGTNAAILCVPASVNSAIGSRWGGRVRGKSKGDNIRVKILGIDCTTVSTDDKRRSVQAGYPGYPVFRSLVKRTDAILKNDTDVIYIDGSIYGNYSGGNVAMIIPFDIPDNFTGTFSLNYNIASGTLKSGSITDDWGEDYGPISVTQSGQSAVATVEVGPDGVGNVMMLAWVDDTQVSVNYTTSLTTSTAAPTTATPAPGPSKKSGASRVNSSGLMFWAVALILMFHHA